MGIKIAIMAMAALLLPAADAQTPTVDHFTQSQLLEKAKDLSEKALGPGGTASSKLNEYSSHFTMIALRTKDGGAEIHENYSEFFLVEQGQATLVTGGSVPDGKTATPGEIRGASVQNGTRTALNPGDVVHIPASVPHQLLVAKGVTFTYFVIKIKEK
jgi:mannose-6-phosphate isomerase-like protein (cupin superfamily)